MKTSNTFASVSHPPLRTFPSSTRRWAVWSDGRALQQNIACRSKVKLFTSRVLTPRRRRYYTVLYAHRVFSRGNDMENGDRMLFSEQVIQGFHFFLSLFPARCIPFILLSLYLFLYDACVYYNNGSATTTGVARARASIPSGGDCFLFHRAWRSFFCFRDSPRKWQTNESLHSGSRSARAR